MKTNLRIGEVLMERNYITQEQMEQALAYQKGNGLILEITPLILSPIPLM